MFDANEDFEAIFSVNDGRWDDEMFITQQAELSAMENAIEMEIM